jgi:hypothetical protein
MAVLKPQIVSMIAEMLAVNRSLQKLEMQYAQMSMSEFQQLMHAVKLHPHLRYLDLTHAKFTYEPNDINLGLIE